MKSGRAETPEVESFRPSSVQLPLYNWALQHQASTLPTEFPALPNLTF